MSWSSSRSYLWVCFSDYRDAEVYIIIYIQNCRIKINFCLEKFSWVSVLENIKSFRKISVGILIYGSGSIYIKFPKLLNITRFAFIFRKIIRYFNMQYIFRHTNAFFSLIHYLLYNLQSWNDKKMTFITWNPFKIHLNPLKYKN